MKTLLVAATLLFLIIKTNSKHFLVKTTDLNHLSPTGKESESRDKHTNKVNEAKKQGEDFAGRYLSPYTALPCS